MKTTAGPGQPRLPRPAFAVDDDDESSYPPVRLTRSELVSWPPPAPRVDALTSELRQRILAAARIPLIGSLLLKR